MELTKGTPQGILSVYQQILIYWSECAMDIREVATIKEENAGKVVVEFNGPNLKGLAKGSVDLTQKKGLGPGGPRPHL